MLPIASFSTTQSVVGTPCVSDDVFIPRYQKNTEVSIADGVARELLRAIVARRLNVNITVELPYLLIYQTFGHTFNSTKLVKLIERFRDNSKMEYAAWDRACHTGESLGLKPETLIQDLVVRTSAIPLALIPQEIFVARVLKTPPRVSTLMLRSISRQLGVGPDIVREISSYLEPSFSWLGSFKYGTISFALVVSESCGQKIVTVLTSLCAEKTGRWSYLRVDEKFGTLSVFKSMFEKLVGDSPAYLYSSQILNALRVMSQWVTQPVLNGFFDIFLRSKLGNWFGPTLIVHKLSSLDTPGLVGIDFRNDAEKVLYHRLHPSHLYLTTSPESATIIGLISGLPSTLLVVDSIMDPVLLWAIHDAFDIPGGKKVRPS